MSSGPGIDFGVVHSNGYSWFYHMTYSDFSATLKKQVAKIPEEKALQLAIVISKMLYPDYQEFVKRNNWGSVELFTNAIEMCEHALDNHLQHIDNGYVSNIINQLQEAIPHSDDFGGAEYAINAGVAVCHTLYFLLERKTENITAVLDTYITTIDLKVQDEYEEANDTGMSKKTSTIILR